jgi:SAM-dependent methyltransferase
MNDWDQRYDRAEYVYGTEPNDFLKKHVASIPKGPVLCLADGEGRNSVFLAEQGYEVTSIDFSEVGLEKANRLAADHGVSINTVCADLSEYIFEPDAWSGIVSIFCHLPHPVRHHVYNQVEKGLMPGGVFLLEAYSPRQLEFGTGGPPSLEMLPEKNRLRDELGPLQYESIEELEREVVEGTLHTGMAAVVQIIATKNK